MFLFHKQKIQKQGQNHKNKAHTPDLTTVHNILNRADSHNISRENDIIANFSRRKNVILKPNTNHLNRFAIKENEKII